MDNYKLETDYELLPGSQGQMSEMKELLDAIVTLQPCDEPAIGIE